MNLTTDEIRVLLGLCVRGLRDIRDDENNDLNQTERVEIQEIGEQVESAYDNLHPWAPDIGYTNGQ